ncbi:hypothetical protein [Alteraurantiacibacter buctensis]|uniref:Uncharacterized protein n=1 Tax=Alteraurantiacibacter buctensis TaxID=1503981 RepID=A0A844Z1B4_9SPHN|nr:hypothetical protein [Alteraurantiacibacter buctensis]MXO73036.1 hypothetical protein [Alteraurantiacibacter buctensis]
MNQIQETVVSRLSGLSSLSSVGAAMAGFGAGLLLADPLAFAALPSLLVGLIVHVYGMVGAARLRREAGHLPSLWQMSGYWACWLTMAVLVAYVALRVAQ